MKEKLKEKLIPKLKTFVKKRWKLLLIVAGVLAAIAIILNALRYTPVGLQLYARVMPSQLITLYTDYGDFTISNGKQSAVFVNGKKVSGDLPVYQTKLNLNKELEEWQTYICKLYLCPLRGKQTYEIVQNTSEWCETLLKGEGYKYRLSSADGGIVLLSDDWIVETKIETEVVQSIIMKCYNTKCSKWDSVYIKGRSDGFTAQVDGKDYCFADKSTGEYEIQVWSYPEDCVFEHYLVDEDGIVLKEKNGRKGVIIKGKEVVETFDISKNKKYYRFFGIYIPTPFS